MKKFISILLSVLILCSVFAQLNLTIATAAKITDNAVSATSGDYEYAILLDGTVKIKKYTGNATELEIPSTIDEYTVTIVGDNAFQNCTSLTSVIFPQEVLSVGNYAFAYCTNITTVVISDSVNDIGDGAFSGCTNLTNVTFGDNVINIGDFAFNDCTSLTSVVLNKGLVSIGEHAFAWCRKLLGIQIPDSVSSIGLGAFSGTYWYILKSNGPVYAGKVFYAYKGSYSIEEISLLSNTKGIAGGAFSSFRNLKSIVIPDSVLTIGSDAFRNCTALSSVTLGNSVTYIGEDAFYNCSSLGAIYIDNVSDWLKIDFGGVYSNPLYYAENLYVNNESISEVVIPDEITKVYCYAFYNCTFLESVYFFNSECEINDSSYTFYNVSPTIYGYEGSTAESYASKYGKTFVSIVEGDASGDGVLTISDATEIQKSLANLAEFNQGQSIVSDVSGDGKLSIRDVTYIQMYIAKMIEEFPI